MLVTLPASDIERFIEEDLPYGDLTTHLLNIGSREGCITFATRHETTLCCTEEAAQVLSRCGARLTSCMPSGTLLSQGMEFLTATGPTHALHAGWKVALNLLEYASGIATRTRKIVDAARTVNPAITVLTTRKSFPGTKKTAIKAISAGGALPHRLGLSESILVFRQHTAFAGGLDVFLRTLPDLRVRAPEHKIIVEADTADEALMIARAGADIVQVDKLPSQELKVLVETIRGIDRTVKISAAGGIHEANASDYAATGVDMLVLSSVYFGKPADISVTITPCGTN
ncbi:ModD protein [Geobacter sp. SVR]|uniref:ModD protein n=1 Tax=Geobacter sp. SVR TaxID=2495594 RepID=UPI00143EF73F|nr:ModD protein [Geobacter sp. SVR]BCS55284.1 ModD protein [Geobacter sp. SVR]GCF86083.1 ModD protein [Geobacter sp. SVR]